MAKIVFYEVVEWQAEYLKKQFPNDTVVFYAGAFGDTSLPDVDADIVSTFLDSRVTLNVLQQRPNVKYVATRTTGFDHINLEACKQRNIPVSNVPTYGENTVAEYTFALLLALSRKMYQSIRRVKEESSFSFQGLEGFDLQGKTIGVIGTGHIGAYVVKIAHGFGMNVIAYDPKQNDKLAQDYGFSYVGFDDLLKRSDVITFHVPYMPATHHMLNMETIKLVKPGAVLINTSRGALLETEALVYALTNGILAGAGLDVIEEEGFLRDELEMLSGGHPSEVQLKTALVDHELMRFPNVLITPHNAFNSTEALTRILDTTVKNIQSFLDGKPINVVNL